MIADIFVLMGDIGSWGQGKGRAGRGERPQDPKGQQGWGGQSRGEEQRRRRDEEQRAKGGDEYDGRNNDNSGTGVQRMGTGNAT